MIYFLNVFIIIAKIIDIILELKSMNVLFAKHTFMFIYTKILWNVTLSRAYLSPGLHLVKTVSGQKKNHLTLFVMCVSFVCYSLF